MTRLENEAILELATVTLREELSAADEAAFDAAYAEAAKRDPAAPMLVILASELMAGSPYSINTNNPETVRRCSAFATWLGASVEEAPSDLPGSLTSLVFTPQRRN
jgi:hypothetical protein